MTTGITFTAAAAKRCNRLLRDESRNWETGLELSGRNGQREVYLSAAKHLFRLVTPNLPIEINNHGLALESGLTVAACFMHTAACVAIEHSLDQSQLVQLARGRASHHTLLIPAKTERKIAVSIEDYTGLRPTDWHTMPKKVAQYAITADGLCLADKFKTLDWAIYYGNNNVEDSDNLPVGRCPAPELGMIYPALDAMVTIADADPRLFAATLAHGTIE